MTLKRARTGHRGCCPARRWIELIAAGHIAADAPISAEQVQPASLDLRLGGHAWRVRASFLPGERLTVEDGLKRFGLHRIDLSGGAVLETGCVYVVPLIEALALPANVSASANPKSSTGRIDVFTRIIADRTRAFDQIPAGYTGPLYAEICPQTFPVLVRTGSRLAQMRFRRGESETSDSRWPRCTNRSSSFRRARTSTGGWRCRSIWRATAPAR